MINQPNGKNPGSISDDQISVLRELSKSDVRSFKGDLESGMVEVRELCGNCMGRGTVKKKVDLEPNLECFRLDQCDSCHGEKTVSRSRSLWSIFREMEEARAEQEQAKTPVEKKAMEGGIQQASAPSVIGEVSLTTGDPLSWIADGDHIKIQWGSAMAGYIGRTTLTKMLKALQAFEMQQP